MKDSITLGQAEDSSTEQRCERRDAAENRQAILDTAAQLFADSGVLNVNMAEIAKSAGVGKGTLYRRFANKGELCLALLDKDFIQFQDEILEALREQTLAHNPPSMQLTYFLTESVGFIDAHLDLMYEIDRAKVVGHPQDINRPHFWMEMTIRGLLSIAITQGEFRADLDIFYLTSALLAPLDARILRSHRHGIGYSLAQIRAGLHSIVAGFKQP